MRRMQKFLPPSSEIDSDYYIFIYCGDIFYLLERQSIYLWRCGTCQHHHQQQQHFRVAWGRSVGVVLGVSLILDGSGSAMYMLMAQLLAVVMVVLLLLVWSFVRATCTPTGKLSVPSCRARKTIGDRSIHLRQVHAAPDATFIEGLMTPAECQYVVEHLAPAAAASGITQSDHTPERTSTVYSLRYQRDDLILTEMLTRLSKLLQVPEDHFEECQMVLYQDGERYGLHHDCLEPRVVSRVPSHQRVATVLVYLTDLPSACGGRTSFPRFNGCDGFESKPSAGSALFWSNVDGATGLPDPRAVHEALAVRKSYCGESVRKVALNVWLRGEAWDTPTARLRILLKRLTPFMFPAVEVAQTYCPNCGVYIAAASKFRDKALHSSSCPIHERERSTL